MKFYVYFTHAVFVTVNYERKSYQNVYQVSENVMEIMTITNFYNRTEVFI